MTAMFIGLVSAYLGSRIWASWFQAAVYLSGSAATVLTALARCGRNGSDALSERKQLRWLEDFSLALSMLAAMLCAVGLRQMGL